MGELYDKYLGYSSVAVKLEKEIAEALSPVFDKYTRMGYNIEDIIEVLKASEDYLKIHDEDKATAKKKTKKIRLKDRNLDFLIAEHVLGWKKISVEKNDIKKKAWQDRNAI